MTNAGKRTFFLLVVFSSQAIKAVPAPLEVAPPAENLAPGYGKKL